MSPNLNAKILTRCLFICLSSCRALARLSVKMGQITTTSPKLPREVKKPAARANGLAEAAFDLKES